MAIDRKRATHRIKDNVAPHGGRLFVAQAAKPKSDKVRGFVLYEPGNMLVYALDELDRVDENQEVVA